MNQQQQQQQKVLFNLFSKYIAYNFEDFKFWVNSIVLIIFLLWDLQGEQSGDKLVKQTNKKKP